VTRDSSAELARILDEVDEADEALRRVVELLARQDGVAWAGVAFLEDGDLTLGPEAGTPDDTHRERVPVLFHGDPVGELLVDGDPDPALLESVAERIAPLVLIGWDTGGETWDP
jgi:hypothetical protein